MGWAGGEGEGAGEGERKWGWRRGERGGDGRKDVVQKMRQGDIKAWKQNHLGDEDDVKQIVINGERCIHVIKQAKLGKTANKIHAWSRK